MAKYSWDINSLLKKRKDVVQRIKEYEEQFDLYNTLIANYDIRGGLEEDEETEDLDEEEVIIKDTSRGKLSLTTGAINVINKFNLKLVPRDYSYIIKSNDELVNETRDMFKFLPNKLFLEKFDEFTNPNNHLLHIRHFHKTPIEWYGASQTDTQDHIPYGLIARRNTIQDVITLAHEVFHMIIRENEIPLFIETNKTSYFETEGFYANLLFSDMLKDKGYSSFELDYFNRKELWSIIRIIKDCFIIENGINLMDEDENIDFVKFKAILKSKNISTPVNKNNFNIFLENDIEHDINSFISYMTALDLYKQYNSDPEKSLYNLTKVPTLDGDNLEKDLESIDTTFFKDGYLNLEGHCKKLLKRKTTSSKK